MMGLPNTTLKRGVKVRNGRLPIPHDKKKKNSVSPNRESKIVADVFDIRGIVHYECVHIGQTVNQVYYLEVLERLREKIRWK